MEVKMEAEPMKTLVHDVVCGMDLPENKVFMTEFVGGVPYAFCSSQCLAEFDTNSAKYIGASREPHSGPAVATTAEFREHEHLTRDPVCGEVVDERTALSAESGGNRFYFCSANCQRAFEQLNGKK